MMNQKSAFTLVEMAIVIVIIGLVIGGIIIGRDLIETGRQTRLLYELGQLGSSANAFRLKYNCIPGDCNPTKLSAAGITTPACPANSAVFDNGYIEMSVNVTSLTPPTCNTYACSCEQGGFPYQLQAAGMLQNQVVGPLSQAFLYAIASNAYKDAMLMPSNWYYLRGIADHWFILQRGDSSGYFGGITGVNNAFDNKALTPVAARSLDKKIDDENPLTGTVRMVSDTSNNPGGIPSDLGVWLSVYPEYGACATSNNPATALYKTQEDLSFASHYGCRIAFKSSF